MKKHASLLIVFTLCCTSLSFAQLKVDTSGRTIFGSNRTYDNGLSTTEKSRSRMGVIAQEVEVLSNDLNSRHLSLLSYS